MVMYASQIQQQIYMSQLAMAQQAMGSQMLSAQMGLAPMPAMMPQMGLMGAATSVGNSGIYGEQMAGRMFGAGRLASGAASLGLGLLGGALGVPLDPFSAALTFGKAGFATMGIGGAAMGAVGGALPFMAAGQMMGAYTNAFSGGMREQASYNSTLRNNFNFIGGGGTMGRGFSQQQMGAIGNMLAAETMRTPFTNSAELNQLIQQGSEAGLFRAVRDVESFGQRFRTMLDGLRRIQRELGGTLSEAMAFTRGAQQFGITPQNAGGFAIQVRDTMAVTGMDTNQTFALAATGSMLSRMTGGLGRQGAVGALRTARGLGSALTTGAISDELLSEATGGLVGQEAISAMSTRLMQMSERFSHRAAGRYALFAMANEGGTGIDETMLDRFRSGDISVGGVMRDAHGRVARMGRARALNMEGRLRGSLLEQGGLAGQIGYMRMLLGDRALEGGDDLAQLVMQRRLGMSQNESILFSSLIRNQGSIAMNEGLERNLGRYQQARQDDISRNRSLGAVMSQFEHGMQEAFGLTDVRQMGREFMTRVSTITQRMIDSFLGVEGEALSPTEQRAALRVATGQGTQADVARLDFGGANAGMASIRDDPFRRSAGQGLLDMFGLHGPRTLGEVMEARGVNLRGKSQRAQAEAVRDMELAQQGILRNAGDLGQLQGLLGDRSSSIRRLMAADLLGGRDETYRQLGASGNAVDAFSRLIGVNNMAAPEYMMPGRGMSGGSWGARAGATAAYGAGGMLAGAITGGASLAWLGPWGIAAGAVAGGIAGGLLGGTAEANRNFMSEQDRALEFLSRGGHLGAAALAEGRQNARPIQYLEGIPLEREQGITGRLEMNALERAAMRSSLNGGTAPSSETLKGLLEGDMFRKSMQRMRGKTLQEQQSELDALAVEAQGLPAEQKVGAQFLIMQLRHNVATMNGRFGAEFDLAMNNPAKAASAMRIYAQVARDYGGMLGNAAGGEFAENLERVTQALYTGNAEGIMSGSNALVRQLSEIDPTQDPERYAAAVRTYGGNETGRALLMAGSQMRAGIRELTGHGRRGMRGAADAAMNLITGGAIGEMEFSVERGGKRRRLDPRSAQRRMFESFRRGDRDAADFERQLSDQLGGMGMKDAATWVQGFVGNVHGGISDEEARGMLETLGKNEDVKRFQQEGVQRALANAASQDPLGKQRNDLLHDIRTAVNKMAKIENEDDLPMSKGP